MKASLIVTNGGIVGRFATFRGFTDPAGTTTYAPNPGTIAQNPLTQSFHQFYITLTQQPAGAQVIGFNQFDPTSGPTLGGRELTIEGSGFLTANIADVKFGSTSAAYFYVKSDTEIVALTPAHSAGAVDVSVIADGGPFVVPTQYTFASPVIDLIATANPTFSGSGISYTAKRNSGSATSASFYYDFTFFATVAFNGSGEASYTFPSYVATEGIHGVSVTAGSDSNFVDHIVLKDPAINSDDTTEFTVGSSGSFDITTDNGYFWPLIDIEESLPEGLFWELNGDGTATISGTPEPGSGGSYALIATANNRSGTPDEQELVLTVNEAPSILSADAVDFVLGVDSTFIVNTGGFPAAALSKSGSLPSGVTFTDNGNGTATLSGTPGGGSAGTYSLTITADNDIGSNATQSFTLNVIDGLFVTSSSDPTSLTAGTLRYAIDVANDRANMGLSSTIHIDPGVTTITLAQGEFVMTGSSGDVSTTIMGNGLTIDASATSSAFSIASNLQAFLFDLTITGANSSGIVNNGYLNLAASTISNNSGSSGPGGLANFGTAIVDSSDFSGNDGNYGGSIRNDGSLSLLGTTISASSAHHGGGLANFGVAYLGEETVIDGNTAVATGIWTGGGGIYNDGDLTIADGSIISDNSASTDDENAWGGGIMNDENGTLLVIDSIVSGNTVLAATTLLRGGGIANLGVATIRSSQISQNESVEGGGVYNFSGGVLTLLESTIDANEALDGGGLRNEGTASIAASTVSENIVTHSIVSLIGGGITNLGDLTIANSTIAANTVVSDTGGASAGGIYNAGNLVLTSSTVANNVVDGDPSVGSYAGGILNAATAYLYNTLVAGNTDGTGTAPDISGTIGGFGNLIGDGTGMTGISDGTNGNMVGRSSGQINLDGLDDNGGPTETMALLTSSFALGTGVTPTTLSYYIDNDDTALIVGDVIPLGLIAGYSVIQIGSELMLVTAVNVGSNTITVERGYAGTSATTHGASVGVNLGYDQRGWPRLRYGMLDIGAFQDD